MKRNTSQAIFSNREKKIANSKPKVFLITKCLSLLGIFLSLSLQPLDAISQTGLDYKPRDESPDGSAIYNDDHFVTCKNGIEYEIQHKIPLGYALTGIGFRAGKRKITTAAVQVRKVNPDGTLGAPHAYYVGRTGSQERPLEVYVEAPPGEVITAFAGRIKGRSRKADFTHLKIESRRIGMVRGEIRLFGSTTISWAGGKSRHELEASCELTPSNDTLITGFGIREHKGDIKNLGFYVGKLK